ncbi:hypothetical protein AN958_10640 [Leucoagaricus sp. SymC.cos]|nr:hypothetical protein AN958_10640 [Leucoagaricus sp. SymC.cos]
MGCCFSFFATVFNRTGPGGIPAEAVAHSASIAGGTYRPQVAPSPIIAIVGYTGSGSSTFIHTVMQRDRDGIMAGEDMRPRTQEITSYPSTDIPRIGKVTLVDVPGFDFHERSERKALQELKEWSRSVNGNTHVDGIVFIHKIDVHIPGSRVAFPDLEVRNILVELCGADWQKRIAFVTTHWLDDAEAKVEYEQKETALKNGLAHIRKEAQKLAPARDDPRSPESPSRKQSSARAGVPSRPEVPQRQEELSVGQSHSEPQSQRPPSQPQSQTQKHDAAPQSNPLPSPSHSKPPPPPQAATHAGPDSSVTSTAPRKRTSHADTPSQQPRTLAEEKAQYNAIPPNARSQYMQMLLALDDIPMIYNLSASFFTWILLAGFILFPGTFTSLQSANLGNGIPAALVNRIANLPLFVVAFICTGIGVFGMGYLWWKWMKNYIWLTNKIFLPGLMNSLAGIILTLANVYGVQNGEFTKTSIITISMTGGVGVVCGLLVLFYGVWMLGLVKKRHIQEVGVEKAGSKGKVRGLGSKIK